jgi:(p)ppGpp synthase/HD superfamily hydrolase
MTSNLLTFISACTALIATIIGPYVAVKTARSQIKANVISSNRAKWIESMRDLVADAISHWTGVMYLRANLHDHNAATIAMNEALLTHIESGLLTNSKIRLMLNASEVESQQLMKNLDAVVASLSSVADQTSVESQVHDHLNEVVRVSQSILKAEWIRVKQGS